jgi:tyrosinase
MTTQAQAPRPAQKAPLRHRKSVDKLTQPELEALREVVGKAMEINDERGFSYFAGLHGEPFKWCEHHTDLFLPWHRAYLYYFELALQALAKKGTTVTLPWWDWTRSSALPAAYTDAPDNPLNPTTLRFFHSPESLEIPPREPGVAAETTPPAVPALPYDKRWKRAMEATNFAEFQRRIEAIHDDVHGWVGGIMRSIQVAAYDPVFYAHHVMVDRAWRIWQYKHPGAKPRDDLLDVALKPNGMTVRKTLYVHRLGYEYAGTASKVPGTI